MKKIRINIKVDGRKLTLRNYVTTNFKYVIFDKISYNNRFDAEMEWRVISNNLIICKDIKFAVYKKLKDYE